MLSCSTLEHWRWSMPTQQCWVAQHLHSEDGVCLRSNAELLNTCTVKMEYAYAAMLNTEQGRCSVPAKLSTEDDWLIDYWFLTPSQPWRLYQGETQFVTTIHTFKNIRSLKTLTHYQLKHTMMNTPAQSGPWRKGTGRQSFSSTKQPKHCNPIWIRQLNSVTLYHNYVSNTPNVLIFSH